MKETMERQQDPAGLEAPIPREDAGVDVIALLFRLLGKIHWILAAGLIGALVAWFYVTRMVTPVYQATSKIYIAGSDTTISLSDLQLGSTLATDYQEVFKIWHVHEMVDERLDLDYSYSKLQGMVSVSNPKNSHLLYINVRSSDPEEAKLLADTYAEVVQDYIANRMELRKPQILERARTPYSPVSPDVRGTVTRGFLAGALGMLVLLALAFLLNDRVCSADDINRAAGLPTFGVVSVQNMEKNAGEQEAPNRIPAEDSRAGNRTALFRGNLVLDYAGREAVNSICSGITFTVPDMKRLLVTSCGAGEGKTFIALQTAIGMTHRGKKVLLVDADLRMSVMRAKYDIRLNGSDKGLAHFLSGQCAAEEIIYRTNIPDLYLLPDGACVKAPLPLLTSEEFDRLMESLGDRFDLVVVDTPPVGNVVDAAEIARRCDGAMLVAGFNQARGRQLRDAAATLRRAGTNVLGCIINKTKVNLIEKDRYYRYAYKAGRKHEEKTRRKNRESGEP